VLGAKEEIVGFSEEDIKQFQLSGRNLLQKHQELHSVSFGYSGESKLSIFVSFTPPIPEKSGRKPKTYSRPTDFPEVFRELPIVGENRLTGVPTTTALAPCARCIRQEVLQPGLDIAAVPADGELHPRRGTLGCIVYDKITGEPMILSNWHVMSGATSLVLQPSSQLMPHGMPPSVENLCGRVMRTCVDLDCAVASLIDRKTDSTMLGLGIVPRRARLPELRDPVVKFGAGNNRSYGIVKRIGIVRMNFGGAFAGILIPCCQIERDAAVKQLDEKDEVRELVRPGDSGCVWMLRDSSGWQGGRTCESRTQDPTQESDPPPPEDPYLRATDTAVALHFGADDAVEELALAVPMPFVLDQLNVDLVPPPQRGN
jgi:hypothetical protein